MPKVSVIMPVFNGENYLSEAIESILAQTLTDWEFIIVNEFGSNEAATAILRQYAKRDDRIRVIQNQTRLRIAESLNVGLRAARGTYIARMDADDLSLPQRLEKQAAYLDRHPEIDICGLNVQMFGENTWDWKVYSEPDYLKCACLFYTPFIHPTIMMRASSLRASSLEYDATFFYTEDYEFFQRASSVLRYTNLADREYKYRYLMTNATNVGGGEGLRLQVRVMKRALGAYGLTFTEEELRLLSPNTYPAAMDTRQALAHLEQLDLLLKRVLLCDALRKAFGIETVFRVLHRRWMDAYERDRWNEGVMEDGQVERAVVRGLFYHERFYTPSASLSDRPRISVVIPTYQSENYIMDTLYSILEQDEPDFEVLIVNEPCPEDRTVECARLFRDPRVRVIQNRTRLGLAESLNEGLRQSAGEYVARADADDVYPKDRFSKQAAFLDAHPEIAVCGTWQRHFGMRNYIHTPPVSPEEMKAALLFKCEVCHSTVMLRKRAFLDRGLLYDKSYLSEDYELWCRASQTLGFATLPEVLGEYRWNGENITEKKMDRLDSEAQQIVARNLKDSLGIVVPPEDMVLLSGWKNPFQEDRPDRGSLQAREEALLEKIQQENERLGAFDADALKTVLDQRRAWAGILKGAGTTSLPTYQMEEEPPRGGGLKRSAKRFLKRLVKPLYRPFRRRYEDRLIAIQAGLWDHDGKLSDVLQTLQDSDGHLYDYYHKLEAVLAQQDQVIVRLEHALEEAASLLAEQNKQLSARCSQEMAQTVTAMMTSLERRIEQTELRVDAIVDSRVTKAEQLINQTTDTRVWKAEQLVNQTTDERIWKAEQLVNQTMDERIWKAEQLVNQTTDERIWKAEQLVNQTMDTRVWKAEQYVQEALQKQAMPVDEIHRHIDFTYRDLMIALEHGEHYLPETKIQLQTDAPVAYESLDHLHPHGTIRDNTRYPRFVAKCEELLGAKQGLSFLDLGCSGGGMVLDAALRGHISMGLEGSDCSLKEQRAEWRLLGDRLQTCDITKPFTLKDPDGSRHLFDIITAWEVMEHIAEADLPQLFENILAHLSDRGYFVASIANWDDIDPVSGVNWHVTVHPYEWWKARFEAAGFEVCSELMDAADLARGGFNPPHCYEAPYPEINEEATFHIVVQKSPKKEEMN